MPELEEVLVDYLQNDAGITAAVGDQIFWTKRPQGLSPPDIIMHKIGDGRRDYNMDGPSGLVRTRVQMDCWGETYAQAVGIGRALRNALSGLTHNQSGVDIFGAFIDSQGEDFDAEADNVSKYQRWRIDFLIWHTE